ncbi:carboxypeptidase-like regulatory domain-containing protein [Pseudarthrobacter sp. J64]|uniref:carboxypeptidase-like regulatory domain-containing protein n=1 Tax=Pseudarthrobacter sp. J64 TaxID=3116485 RepID=UPI002E8121F0|nr:carboxypeptidase-like regulatory domain-containing protein [Pseudarthrobacter sp. J64]MEE2568865.1 carboxypeptidase-like regulatory domain-containing protein [Pseudarthrobacter sp. J64]
MGVVRTSLTELVGLLNNAIAPDHVTLDDGSAGGTTGRSGAGESLSGESDDPDDPSGTTIRPTALTRVGRSRRDGPVLDLELTARIECRGPNQLDNLEKLLLAVEHHSQYATAPVPETPIGSDRETLGFLVRIPVSVRLEEPSGPPVREPLITRLEAGRTISGRVLDSHNNGIPHARIRVHSSANAVVSDDSGRFEVLASADELQNFAVAVRGTERQLTATTRTLPVTLRWE